MLVALVGLSALANPSGPAPQALRAAVVVVRQGGSACAGVVLSDGRVATAYHCVAAGFRARLERLDGALVTARVQATDPGHDLAVLTAATPLSGGLSLGTAPRVGEAITVIGHPFGGNPPGGFLAGTLRWSVSTGRVAAVGDRSLQVDATVAPGNSGGPVIDDDGRVVGIVSRRIGDRIGFAGRAEALAVLTETPRRAALGGTFSVAPAAWTSLRPTVGLDLEVTWRDRVVLGARGGVPIAPLLRAVLDRSVEATVAQIRVGARAPIGHGAGSLSFDAFAAVGVTQVWTSEDGGSPEVRSRVDPFVGAAVGRGSISFDVAYRVSDEPGADWLLGLRFGLGALRRVW
ncbi:MAG: serine protease [Myxococcota bacterium]